MLDIVIPIGPKDIDQIYRQVIFTKKNILDYRNIYIVSPHENLHIDGCISIPESIFPFSIETISNNHGKINRNGWYLQQLIKLYSGLFIPNISENYLVIDADTFFLKPTLFVDQNKTLFNPGTEYHLPYFEHMYKLHPSLIRVDPKISGISHHMVFNTICVSHLISLIENHHKNLFYHIFLNNVDIDHRHGSGASEYELYFNFMLIYYPELVKIRKLKWANVSVIDFNNIHDYDYVSNHSYMRNK